MLKHFSKLSITSLKFFQFDSAPICSHICNRSAKRLVKTNFRSLNTTTSLNFHCSKCLLSDNIKSSHPSRSFGQTAGNQSGEIDFDTFFADEEDDFSHERGRGFTDRRQGFSGGRGFTDRRQDFSAGHGFTDRQQGFSGENRGFDINLDDVKTEFDGSDFRKDFYEEFIVPNNTPKEAVDQFLQENSIKVSGKEVTQPVLSFEEISISEDLMQKLKRSGFEKPTPIQSVTWPVTLSGRNVIGIAQTGSGKTLSFLLPAMIHISAQRRPGSRQGPIALVLCPTRELAKQCQSVANQYFSGIVRTTCLFGGGEKSRQINDLNRGCELVVATPGRLMDLLSTRQLGLNRCTFLVLDEADRMLDMGFEPQIRRIIDLIRPDRQVTMWSATWPDEVRELASRYLRSTRDAVHIRVGSAELTANSDVEQKFVFTQSERKSRKFLEALDSINKQFVNENRVPKILVFSNMKRSCDNISRLIRKSGLRAEAIHGDITQRNRDFIMDGFRRSSFPVLVATDVAARGLDVNNIDYVINYDAPLDSVSYIHRIGRTGRGGKKGTSLTFLSQTDGSIVGDLIKSLRAIDHPVDEKLIQMESWWKKQMRQQKTQKNSWRRNDSYGSRRSSW